MFVVYDLVALVEADSLSKLKDTVAVTIRRINGVRSTLTMIVVE